MVFIPAIHKFILVINTHLNLNLINSNVGFIYVADNFAKRGFHRLGKRVYTTRGMSRIWILKEIRDLSHWFEPFSSNFYNKTKWIFQHNITKNIDFVKRILRFIWPIGIRWEDFLEIYQPKTRIAYGLYGGHVS